MAKYSAFDILGPVMIGPSSSHTAGAARLAKIAGMIGGEGVIKVEFVLHGSFAKTYKGHGTDRALVAGILGIDPWDEKLKYSLELAESKGLKYEFIEGDLGDVHPNTVKFILTKQDGRVMDVTGSSIGGGNIIITGVDGENVEFTGEYPTLILKHKDIPGMVSKVTTVLYEEKVNIAFMKVFRSSKGLRATMVFEMDSAVPEEVIKKIKALANITGIRYISPVAEGV